VDLNAREIGLLLPLAALMLILGFVPMPFLAQSEPAVQSLIDTAQAKALDIKAAEGEAVVVSVIWPEAVAAAPVPLAE